MEARDAVTVLSTIGYESAYVFGNSCGAIFALEMTRSHTQAIKIKVLIKKKSVSIET